MSLWNQLKGLSEIGQQKKISKTLIYVTIFLSMVTYLFWREIKVYTGFEVFFIGNSVCIFIMAIVIYSHNKGKFYSFYLLCITFQNVLDELVFDNTVTDISEYVFAIILPIIWLIKNKQICQKDSYKKAIIN